MPRSTFGLASLWGGLAVLSFCGSASAQWFPGSGGGNCGCSSASYMGAPPIMRQTAAAFGAAPMMTASYAYGDQCGAPFNCQIEQPVQAMQTVHVQAVAPVTQTVVAVKAMQAVVQPIMENVSVTEYQPVKRTVSKPVLSTEYVDQAVTVMTPVTEQRTANVSTVDYQTITEYKTVRKQVGGGWVTNNVPTNRVSAYQYDNRPNVAGAMNRATYNLRSAFTPPYQQTRSYTQPQMMTCTVPCQKRVAVPGMKQVTYNVTRMQPTQTTRKVAVTKTTYQTAEVTVMAPVQVVKTMQVGTRVSYAPAGSTTAIGSNPASGGIGLAPTPLDQNSSAVKPRSAQTADPNNSMDPEKINKQGASLETYDSYGRRLSDASIPAKTFTAAAKPSQAPSVIRVSQWVARTPSSSSPSTSPTPVGKSAAISIADSAQ